MLKVIIVLIIHKVLCILCIDTNPLRNVTFINGTGLSPPGTKCVFTDDVMITNNFSNGCVVYFTNMDQPVYVPREDYASNAMMNITDITNSGYYNITVISLPFPFHHLDSVYISVDASEYNYVNI